MVGNCTGWVEPLDLQCLLVNNFAGSMELFSFMAFVAIAGIGAYFRMLNVTLLIMFGLFAIMMGEFLELQGIYFIAVLLVGLITSFLITRLVKN